MRDKIIEEAVKLFNVYNFKFKLDDIAKNLHISKKTIYKYFDSKEDIFKAFILDGFDSMRQGQEKIMVDDRLSTKMKLTALLNTRCSYESKFSMDKAIEIRDYYPEMTKLVLESYSSQWKNVDTLLTKGKEEKVFSDEYPNNLIIEMLSHAIFMVHERGFLRKNHLTYRRAIAESVAIIIEGISIK